MSGAALTINPTTNLAPYTGYYVQIAPTAITDTSRNCFAGIADSTTWNFTTGAADTIPPALGSLNSPANGAYGVPADPTLVLTFNEPVQKGTGNIVIRRADDGSAVATIAVTGGNVTVNGAQVTIVPDAVLPAMTSLYVEIDAGVFRDLSGNPFAGISGAGTWSFSTALRLTLKRNLPAYPFQLAWQSSTGKLYNVRSSADLSSWTLLQGVIPATPPTNTQNLAPAESALFYRVEEALPVTITNGELAVVLGVAPTPAETRVAELLAGRITERSGIGLAQSTNEAALRLVIGTVASNARIAEFAATHPEVATLGLDGYVIAVDQHNPDLYVAGQSDSGVVAGVGRLMREMSYLTGRIELPSLQLTEVPQMPNRGMYLWARDPYFSLPDQVDSYVEELALWGCNGLAFWFEKGEFSSFDDANAQYWLGMYRRFYATAKRLGMKTGLFMTANDGYNTSPVDMRISPIIGTPDYYLCPHKPGALDQLLAWHEQVFQALPQIDICNLFPADPGGCSTADCTPWPTHGFWPIVQPLAERIHQISPQTQIWIDTWHLNNPTFGGKDWTNLVNLLDWTQAAPEWFTGLEVAVAPNHPYAANYPADRQYYNNAKRPLTVFPDVSMYGNHTGMLVKKDYWKSLQAELNDYSPALMKGGWPYSERWNTDIANMAFVSWFWNPNKSVETVLDEYASFYFGPQAATGRYLLDLLDDSSNDPAKIRETLATLQASLPQWVTNDWRWAEIVAACQYKAP